MSAIVFMDESFRKAENDPFAGIEYERRLKYIKEGLKTMFYENILENIVKIIYPSQEIQSAVR